MDSAFTIASSSSSISRLNLSSNPSLKPSILFLSNPKPKPFCVRSSSEKPIFRKVKSAAGAIVIAVAAASAIGKLQKLPARADPAPATLTEELDTRQVDVENNQEEEKSEEFSSPLTHFLDSNSEAIDALKSLLQQKIENGEDEEALKILEKLVLAQPGEMEWKFLMARLLNEMGKTQEARGTFEEILRLNPLSFEALFENALLMDRFGEGEAVIKRLEEALQIAEEEEKAKEARDVRLIIAQIQFLQKNVDEALRSYEQLEREDPKDFRPYFCKGMIFSLLDKNKEAREQFQKYRELSPKKFEVEGYLRSPMSRMKLFGTGEDN